MTAIATAVSGAHLTLRNATAQATVGQTDWVAVPQWATYMHVFLNYTATAGTTPLVDFKILAADPVAYDDAAANSVDFGQWDGITQIAGASAPILIYVQAGPGIVAADDDTAAIYKINSPLPPLLGFVVTLDRTTANETYTYSLHVSFK